jgi:hypothetical protein
MCYDRLASLTIRIDHPICDRPIARYSTSARIVALALLGSVGQRATIRAKSAPETRP